MARWYYAKWTRVSYSGPQFRVFLGLLTIETHGFTGFNRRVAVVLR